MADKKVLGEIRNEFERCMPIFVALGDEVRQQIILSLICAGCDGLRVGDITQQTHLSRPAISHHLKVLKDAEVIHLRKKGTMNYYYLSSDTSLASLCSMTKHITILAEQIENEQNTQAKKDEEKERAQTI